MFLHGGHFLQCEPEGVDHEYEFWHVDCIPFVEFYGYHEQNEQSKEAKSEVSEGF